AEDRRQGHLRRRQNDVRRRPGVAPRPRPHRTRRPPPRSELERADGRGVPGPGPGGDGGRAARLGRRRQLRFEARRDGRRRGRHDRLARLAAGRQTAAALAPDDAPDPERRRTLERQPRVLARRLRRARIALRLGGPPARPAPARLVDPVRPGPADRPAAVGRGRSPVGGAARRPGV
ncbi:MAG: Adenylate kinase, partial [uncultured Thermomicrobiales bacterium]